MDDGLSEAIPISEGFLLGGLAHYVAYVSCCDIIILLYSLIRPQFLAHACKSSLCALGLGHR